MSEKFSSGTNISKQKSFYLTDFLNENSQVNIYHYVLSPDNACWDINKELRCFYAEPNCPQREDRRLDITLIDCNLLILSNISDI